jgi:DNA invertase Pin-like site-specific DNA recombinase
MLVGYMRVSKADGSQVLDLQKDALLAAGVDTRNLYDDRASGIRDDRPGLTNCHKGTP